MSREFKGKLVRFEPSGVGVAKLADARYVYFKPRQVVKYQGETIDELVNEGFSNGRALIIQVSDEVSAGSTEVEWVRLASA